MSKPGLIAADRGRSRCFWAGTATDYVEYHDKESFTIWVKFRVQGVVGSGPKLTNADLEHLRSLANITNVQYLHFPAMQ